MEGLIASGAPVRLRGRSVVVPSCAAKRRAEGHFFALPPRPDNAALKLRASKGFSIGRFQSRVLLVRASTNGKESVDPIAPFQPESPTGQFLTELLHSHPHLVPAAVERELERLAENREAEGSKEQPNSSGTELILYRRIAEVKAQERQKALEEIIYTLIVQKFVEAGVAMVPNLSSLISSEKPCLVQVKELESVHSAEAWQMIHEHVSLVLGGRGSARSLVQNTVAQISKQRLLNVYAASILYGYFLRRVDHRFQLEKTWNLHPPGLQEAKTGDEMLSSEGINASDQDSLSAKAMSAGRIRFDGVKPSQLRSFVMSLDAETLHSYATVRSKESLSVLEKHTEALFGRTETQILPISSMTIGTDEVLKLSIAGLKRLVLEAVAFGSFLWDVEGYADSCYSFVTS